MNNEMPTYLRTAEAAEYLSVSAHWLAQLRYLGGGPAFVKMGRSVRYKREDLDRWAQQGRVESGQTACHEKSLERRSAA